jgi:hypothetical protein
MSDAFEGWAIVELLGRTRVAGHVTADGPLLQATRLLVDIYDGDAEQPSATQLICLPVWRVTPCTEAIARGLGPDALQYSMPIAQWELKPPRTPAIGSGDDGYVDAEVVEPDYEGSPF